MIPHHPHAGRSQDGSTAAELVILTPLLVIVAVLFAIGGRFANALQEVNDIARTSVESAVIASTAPAAQAQALAAARYAVSGDGLRCSPYSATVDIGEFAPGGLVSVEIRCGIGLLTPTLGGLPDHVVVSARATAGIEPYREAG
jgi:hypothetical protein